MLLLFWYNYDNNFLSLSLSLSSLPPCHLSQSDNDELNKTLPPNFRFHHHHSTPASPLSPLPVHRSPWLCRRNPHVIPRTNLPDTLLGDVVSPAIADFNLFSPEASTRRTKPASQSLSLRAEQGEGIHGKIGPSHR